MEKVLITGCSSGFGYKTALLLADNNFEVTASTRHKDFHFDHPNIKHLYLDMLDLPKQLDEDYDIVIFNAGVLDFGLAVNVNIQSTELMMETNFIAITKLSKMVIEKMKEKKKGKLIFISSLAASRPLPGLSSYSASKAAIEAYARSLYLELSLYNIEVFVLAPGFYKTDLWNDVSSSQDELEENLKKFAFSNKKSRDVKEVTFQILKICEGKSHRFYTTFSVLERLSVIFRAFIYTKVGKIGFKWALIHFQKMKTQK